MAQILSTPLTVVHVIACLFLMLVVLVQPGKSGGLGAFTGVAAQQVFGGRGAGNILTKTTWVTATVFFFTSITLAYLSSSSDESLEKRTKIAQTHDTKVPVSKLPPVTPAPRPVPTPVLPPPPVDEEQEAPLPSASAPAPASSVQTARPKPAVPRLAPATPRPAPATTGAPAERPAPAPAPASAPTPASTPAPEPKP